METMLLVGDIIHLANIFPDSASLNNAVQFFQALSSELSVGFFLENLPEIQAQFPE